MLEIFLILGVSFIVYAILEEFIIAKIFVKDPEKYSPMEKFMDEWCNLVKEFINERKEIRE